MKLLFYKPLAEGLYFYKLKRWMSVFNKEQFLILKSEDFYSNTADTMHEVFDFLSLSPYTSAHYPKYNIGNYDKITPALRQQLEKIFAPHNEKLTQYLGRDFSWQPG
ncbi:MAG: sulfotransferase domain-containing protein [Phormidesmis sp.]